MEIKTTVGSLITLMVAVLVIALVALPVLTDVSTPGYQGTNAGADARFTEIESAPTFTMVFDSSTSITTLTIGDKTQTLTLNNNVPLLISSTLWLRTTSANTGAYFDLTNGVWHFLTGGFTVDVVNGAVSIEDGNENTLETSIGKTLLRTNDGPLGRYTGEFRTTIGEPYYIGAFFGNTVNGPSRLYVAIGDDIESTYVSPFEAANSPPGSIATSSEVTTTITYTETEGAESVGVVEGVTQTWTAGTSITAGGGTALCAIAPIAYESTAEDDGDPTMTALMSVIAMLLIIVPIMVAVRILRGA